LEISFFPCPALILLAILKIAFASRQLVRP
jgi:hypothetical protein